MIVLALVLGFQIMLFRSRWGLRTRSVGEHPEAADTVGINVIWVRYRNVLIGGMFAGLAGAYLTLAGQRVPFQTEMTAGRGFIALAAVIVGRWTPDRRLRRRIPVRGLRRRSASPSTSRHRAVSYSSSVTC